MYEVKILETLHPSEAAQGRGPQPRLGGASPCSTPFIIFVCVCVFLSPVFLFLQG